MLAVSYLALDACISIVFQVFQTKVAPLLFCLIRIKMPLLTCIAHVLPAGYPGKKIYVPWVGADFREGDVKDSNFSLSRVQRFTESPGPLH